MGKGMNIQGAKSTSSAKVSKSALASVGDVDVDADDNAEFKKVEGMYRGSRNGRGGKNQIHEKGNTSNGNTGENMLNAGTLQTPTEIVRGQVGTKGSMASRKGTAILGNNTTSPELRKP